MKPNSDRFRMRVRWIRYSSAAALVREWRRVAAKEHRVALRAVNVSPEMLPRLLKIGMWAFTDVRAKPPVVRYWAASNVKPERLAMMFGHELGHAVGRPARGHVAEEERADEYGRVAAEAFRRLTTTPPQPRRKRGA